MSAALAVFLGVGAALPKVSMPVRFLERCKLAYGRSPVASLVSGCSGFCQLKREDGAPYGPAPTLSDS
jgi:hypothetical protein